MNWDQVEGNWKELKGKVRANWAKITDSDFDLIGGKKDQLIGRLQKHYGYQKEKAERDVDQFVSSIDTLEKKVKH